MFSIRSYGFGTHGVPRGNLLNRGSGHSGYLGGAKRGGKGTMPKNRNHTGQRSSKKRAGRDTGGRDWHPMTREGLVRHNPQLPRPERVIT